MSGSGGAARPVRGSVLDLATRPVIRSEHAEQAAVIRWALGMEAVFPVLALLYAVPNAAKRTKRERVQKLREGLRAGVPDLVLPCARGGYYGLYLELKRERGPGVRASQRGWLTALAAEGYCCAVARGADAAQAVLVAYLTGADLPAGTAAEWWAADEAQPSARAA